MIRFRNTASATVVRQITLRIHRLRLVSFISAILMLFSLLRESQSVAPAQIFLGFRLSIVIVLMRFLLSNSDKKKSVAKCQVGHICSDRVASFSAAWRRRAAATVGFSGISAACVRQCFVFPVFAMGFDLSGRSFSFLRICLLLFVAAAASPCYLSTAPSVPLLPPPLLFRHHGFE